MGAAAMRIIVVMALVALIAVTNANSDALVQEDLIVPEEMVEYDNMRTLSAKIRKVWSTYEVRTAAETALLETDMSAASTAEATARVAYSEAVAAVQKTGSSACEDLAKTTINAIKQQVEASQGMLDALEGWKHCAGEREIKEKKEKKKKADEKAKKAPDKVESVKQATENLNNAKKDEEDAKKKLELARKETVHYGSHMFKSLTTCSKDKSICWNDAMEKAYGSVLKNVKAAEKAVDNAHKKVEAAIKELDKAKAEYEKEWDIVSKGKSAREQEVAYSRAQRMLCVVHGVAEKDCKIDVPKVKKAVYLKEVLNAKCDKTDATKKKPCHTASLKGYSSYAWDPKGKYCYKVIFGKYVQQDWNSNAAKCDKGQFTSNVHIGKYQGDDHLYKKGSFCKAVNKDRQVHVTVKQDPNVAQTTAHVIEPSTCNYKMEITQKSC